MARWRLLRGTYSHQCQVKDDKGRVIDNVRHYKPGEIIDSEDVGDIDFEKFNGQGMTPKYSRVDDEGRSLDPRQYQHPEERRRQGETLQEYAQRIAMMAAQEEARRSPPGTVHPDAPTHRRVDLAAMSVAELQAHAAEEEIDLDDATSREDILAAIQLAKGQPATPARPPLTKPAGVR